MVYKGSCHCGQISFEIEGTIEKALECNCTICTKKGLLLWFQPWDQVKFVKPNPRFSKYNFNTMKIDHLFCPDCGCQPIAEAADPKGVRTAALNIRCFDNIDIATVPRMPYDGRSR